jgi:hypothetical protein
MSTPMINIKCTFRRPFGKLLFCIHYFTGINFPLVGWVMKIEVIK